jgi:hypothetical protein
VFHLSSRKVCPSTHFETVVADLNWSTQHSIGGHFIKMLHWKHCLAYSSTLKIEGACSSETLASNGLHSIISRTQNSSQSPLWEPQILCNPQKLFWRNTQNYARDRTTGSGICATRKVKLKMKGGNNFGISVFHPRKLKVINKHVKCKQQNVYRNRQLYNFSKWWRNITRQGW